MGTCREAVYCVGCIPYCSVVFDVCSLLLNISKIGLSDLLFKVHIGKCESV